MIHMISIGGKEYFGTGSGDKEHPDPTLRKIRSGSEHFILEKKPDLIRSKYSDLDLDPPLCKVFLERRYQNPRKESKNVKFRLDLKDMLLAFFYKTSFL